MNLLFDYQKKIFVFLHDLKEKKIILIPSNLKSITVELPPKDHKADISCNASMVLAKINSSSPTTLAEILKKHLMESFKEFKSINIVKPGFLNISFQKNFWKKHLSEVVKLKSNYGSNIFEKQNYNIEFVSANPTGPLHVGHCRGAVLGDTLANLLKFNGHTITKEYYVNDYGGQIKNFVLSVYYRILEILKNEKYPDKNDLYPGEYIIKIAKKIIEDNTIKDFSSLEKIYKKLSEESLLESMKIIKKNLFILGIKHDNFVYESDLVKANLVEETVKNLKKKDYIYTGTLKSPKGEKTKEWKTRNQLLFKSTLFGDDVDRALQKSDYTWTYFASDIAYHSNKISRKFDYLINILGADHAGYIKRITAATNALSNNKTNLTCKVSQLVKLYKNGKPFKMSKRKGDYVTVEDLIKEVGLDSVRFMMLSRSNDVELDFDFQRVTEKSKDNPVFYIQYAFARIHSIFRQLNINIENAINIDDKKFDLNYYEIQILKKISEWPRCVETSTIKIEPHRITFYLYDLVTLFHSYWNLGNENKDLRFAQIESSSHSHRLKLLQALSIVIKNGMSILGVTTPRSM